MQFLEATKAETGEICRWFFKRNCRQEKNFCDFLTFIVCWFGARKQHLAPESEIREEGKQFSFWVGKDFTFSSVSPLKNLCTFIRSIWKEFWAKLPVCFVKVYTFWEGHKILQNFHSRFDYYYIGQIYGGDFAFVAFSEDMNFIIQTLKCKGFLKLH